MQIAVVIAAAFLVVGLVVGLRLARRPTGAGIELSVSRAVSEAVAAAHRQAALERDAAVQAALAQAALLNGEQLAAKKDVIDTRLEQVHNEMAGQLQQLARVVDELGRRSTEQFGRVDASLRTHAEIAQTLSASTSSLREALASTKARGQWGERMAEDVLRLAGFQEHINYVKQTAVDGARGLPDFTFFMPKEHVLYMDVKFPVAAYLRYLEAGTDAERAAHRDAFVRDVRLRVKELAQRDYARAGDRPAVDYVLLFLPNESIAGFVHEHDPELIDHALGQRVVLCSPLTLFALLGVIRQAFDQFTLEQTSNEILQLLGKFSQQWGKFTESMEKVRTRFESVQREFESLATTRRRALERPLTQLDALRAQRGLPVEGELMGGDVVEFEGYRELGA